MIVLAQVDVADSVEEGLSSFFSFIPKLLGFLLILILGYIVAKVLASVLEKILDRVGFDRMVERGGIKKALAKSKYDPSDILSKIVFYIIFLFVLQLAFGVFGDNPISDLLTSVIAFLPKIFVAIIIIVVAAAIAAAAKEIIEASLGGLSYGKTLANVASIAIMAIGVFAALNQIEVAPEIVNGLFYAALALVVGSGIIAIGGGGIDPMRKQWEQAVTKAEEEAPKLKEEAEGSQERIKERAEKRKEQAKPDSSPSRRPRGGSTPAV